MSDFPVIVYHNSACGTSRNVLAMIRESGVEPTVVEYLKVGWARPTLERLAAATRLGARGLLRERGTPAEALGLLDPAMSDTDILAAMMSHPILVNRPIVETPRGTRLCRPSEQVFDLLENPPFGFTREDGEKV